jgi:hypothetical protein
VNRRAMIGALAATPAATLAQAQGQGQDQNQANAAAPAGASKT